MKNEITAADDTPPRRRRWATPVVIKPSKGIADVVRGPGPPYLDGSGASSASSAILKPVHS